MNAQMVFILVKKTQLLVCILAAPIVSGALTAVHGQSAEQLDKEAIGTYDRGNISQAILLYQQLVKLQPDSVPVRTDLGKGKGPHPRSRLCLEVLESYFRPKQGPNFRPS